ncbi:MAG: ABC transporter ATP-binding protein [Bacteroidetes bacterium]|nr:ABC transporter ATP-binding protein [Bacteroidota bacterium]
MKVYLRILGYVKKYPGYIAGFSISVVLMALFGSISLALLDPVMKLLFSAEEVGATEGLDGFSLNIHSIKNAAYYFVSQVIRADGKQQALLVFILIIVSVNTAANLFRYVSNACTSILRTSAMYNLRNDLLKSLINKNIAFIDKQRKGDLLARMTIDIDEIDRSIVGSLNAVIKNPVQIALYLTLLLQYSKPLTGIILLVLPVSALFIGTVGRSLKKNAHTGQRALASMIGVLEESLGGLRVIKAFGAERYIVGVFDTFHRTFRRMERTQLLKMFLASPFSETSGVIAVGIILWYGGSLVFSGQLEASGFMTYVFIFTQTLQPAKELSASISRIYKGIASGERVFGLMDQPVLVKDKPNAQSIVDLKEGIEFRNVHFQYGQNPVIQGLEMTLAKGGFYALVGPSGCGKSTLTELLLRFYDPQQGGIYLDGVDISNIQSHSLRAQIAIVNQDPILFNDTVFNNISFGLPHANQGLVEAAAMAANAHGFISQLSQGYQTIIGDRGVLLSGGQRQRISIARAILKQSPILLLDEATSALDAESEREVQQALDTLMKDKTSLVVAHRLSTIHHADCIYVMDKGRIVEMGRHHELIAQKGLYWKLYEIQQLSANQYL